MGVVAYPAFPLQDVQDTGVCSNFILNSLTFIFLCFCVWLCMEMSLKQRFLTKHYEIEPQHIQTTTPELFWNRISQDFYSMAHHLICQTAVFSVVTQGSSTGEERCVTALKTAV